MISCISFYLRLLELGYTCLLPVIIGICLSPWMLISTGVYITFRPLPKIDSSLLHHEIFSTCLYRVLIRSEPGPDCGESPKVPDQ